jgi:phage tail-like protein
VKKVQIKRLLPSVFQRAVQPESPLSAILDLMEAMHAPSESTLDHLSEIFDPHRTPDAFVAYLASWVDLESLLDVPRSEAASSTPTLSTGIGRLRELAAAAVTLSHWRGTRKGLCLFLETATGMSGFEIDEHVIGVDGRVRPFHLCVTAPGPLAEHSILIQRIVESEKPAYMTYELRFGSQQEKPDGTN